MSRITNDKNCVLGPAGVFYQFITWQYQSDCCVGVYRLYTVYSLYTLSDLGKLQPLPWRNSN